MRAIVFNKYGDPKDVMNLIDNKEKPSPGEDEVLIKIEGSSINAADKHMVRANYFIIRLLLGIFRPSKKNRILGVDIAGTIEAIGKNVKNYKIGDEVAADIRKSLGGGFAEYVVVKAKNLVKKPSNISFEQAASVPISGQAAMMGIYHCDIKAGDKVLINGASGGVGSFAVQIAKAKGAYVVAMSSEKKVASVMSWGADEVIDYKKISISDLGQSSYDAVFDTACFGSPGDFAKILKDDGCYVLVGGDYYDMLRVKFFGRFYQQANQKFKTVTQDIAVTKNIEKVFELIEQGKIKPAIQKILPLKEVPKAISFLEDRLVVGKIVINNQK